MKQIGDDELRACFHTLRDCDARDLPDFRTLTRARARRPATPALVWSGAAACLILVAASAVRLTRRAVGVEPLDIATWRSPTASLLDVSGRELLAPAPILSSVFDGVTRQAIVPKGD